jgi:hypothetical protein
MATFTKVNDFLDNFADVMDMNNDTFRIALSNTAPASETSNPLNDGNGVLANVTEIAYANYSDNLTVDRQLEGVTSAQVSGTYKFDFGDFTITASGGSIADFRYIYVYDDTPTSPADPIVAVWDIGSTISLGNGDSLAITVSGSGAFTIS